MVAVFEVDMAKLRGDISVLFFSSVYKVTFIESEDRVSLRIFSN